jgi:eukaryotic-like serine/threonine-protein kinase
VPFSPANTTAAQSNSNARDVRDLVGTELGRFRICEHLGGGGGGEVFLAEDTALKRKVALKKIGSRPGSQGTSHHRLWKEAELASRLDDPHIAAVYDVIEHGDELFVVMEYVQGETLRKRLSRSMTVEEFLPIAIQCASAIAAAHRVGLVHRDIKPENIMLTPEGRVKVLDFGLACELPTADARTRSDTSVAGFSGTLFYMAPEAVEQRKADARTDIFSLGVVFYEALAAKNPFYRSGFLAVCEAILHDDPPPLREQNGSVPKDLESIILRMMRKKPDERYFSAADVRSDLEAVQRGLTLPGAETPVGSSRVPLRKYLGAVILAAILAGGIGAGVWEANRQPRAPILNEHGTLLLGDFENYTGQKILDGTVTEAVRESLEQSRYIGLVTRSQVVEAELRMGRGQVPTLDRELGREICQRENFRALLTGRIANYGSRFRVTAQVVDPWRGDTILVEEASFNSPADLYPAVDEVTQRLRRHLGESLTQVQENAQPLQRVTTTSLEALQRYSRAMEYYAAGDLKSFVPLANGAIELDPNFAMAHFYLGSAYDALGKNELGEEQLALALRSLERVTERERHLILGSEYDHQGIYEKGAEEYRVITELYPGDVEAHRALANSSADAGNVDEAISAAQRALDLDPHQALSYQRVIWLLVQVNKFPAALATYESAGKQGMKSPLLHWGAGLAYWGEDDLEASQGEFEKLRAAGGEYEQNLASLYLARVLIYQGRLREGTDALRAGLILDEKTGSEGWSLVRRYLLAKALRAEGDDEGARKEAALLERSALEERRPLMRWAQGEEMRRAGAVAVEQGDLSTARQILAHMGTLPSLNQSGFTRSCFYNLQGLVESAAARADSAIESERQALLFFPGHEPYRALGDEYAARKEWQSAAQAYGQYLQFKGEILRDDSPSDWVLAHLSLARALTHQGDTARALNEYDEFLRLWANADAGIPVIREARRERERVRAAIDGNSSSSGGIKPAH